MRVGDVLRELQARAQRDRSQGLPLYAYKISDAELLNLRCSLRLTAPNPDDELACAAFCAFAAMTFCQAYAGGPWSWRPVLDPLGWAPNPVALYGVVVRGLRYWHRPLRTEEAGDRLFLVTLAAEGGFPRWILRDSQAHLHRMLSETLEDKLYFPELPGRWLAGRHASILPRSIRHPETLSLAGALVDQLYAFQLGLRGRATSDPVSTLDSERPGWRGELPVALDDATALELVRGLLGTSLRSTVTHRQILTLRRQLRDGQVERSFRLSDLVSVELLERMLGGRPLPPRFDLELVDDSGRTYRVGLATRTLDAAQYRLERVDVALPVGPALRLCVRANGEPIGSATVRGGDALGPLPWVFAPEGELLGQGSVSSRHRSLVVASPKSITLNPLGTSSLQPIGTVLDRELFELRGQATSTDSAFVLRSGDAIEDSAELTLEGRRLSQALGEVPAFLGPPCVRESRADGLVRAWEPSQLEIEPACARSTRRLGTVRIRVRADGRVRFEAIATLLPEDFALELRAGDAPGTGVIRTSHGTLGLIRSDALEDAQLENSGALIKLSGARPGRADLAIEFEEASVRLRIELPVRFCGFLDREGTLLGKGRVALGSLRGARAIVRDRDRPRAFALQIGQSAQDGLTRFELRRLEPGRFELPLDDVLGQVERELITAAQPGYESAKGESYEIDDTVELSIVDRASPLQRLRVGWYETSLRHESMDRPHGPAIHFEARPAESAAGLRVFAQPFEDPARPEVELTAQGTGWDFELEGRQAGPWRFLGYRGNLVATRPHMRPVAGELSETASALVRATRADELQRARPLADVVRALGEDASHPDWPLALATLATMESVPPHTYDLTLFIARAPNTFALAVLQAGSARSAILRGFERLGSEWWLIPLRSWRRAAECMLQLFRSLPLPDPAHLCSGALEPCLAELATFSTGFTCAIDEVRQTLGGASPPTPAGPSLVDLELDLRRRYPNVEAWPGPDFMSLEKRAARLGLDLTRPTAPTPARGVLIAPALAAAATVEGWVLAQEERLALRHLRAFDLDFFAHAQILHTAALRRLRSPPR
ncbi:MAG: hypothetical protein HYV07_13210 [Deltaproteobacteria bacterium]|nr:hypothetical protein [Deltaproteobacteria bacterium]